MENFLNLAWVVPIPPFIAFAAILLFLNRNKVVSAITAIAGVAISMVIGWTIAFTAFLTPHFGEHPVEGQLFTIPTGSTSISVGYQVDPANALMLFMVCFVMLMIFIYASGYMSFPHHLKKEQYPEAYAEGKDPRYSRFMAYLSLFATGMLGLVVSNSLITFFIFWEIMGLCSYLLIGFWYEKESARKAALKAFMTTRIGDAIMLIGMMLLYAWGDPPSLMFHDIFQPANLEQLANRMVAVPLFGTTVSAIGMIAVLLLFGTIGKSAQFPLHVWLPDAMEGPTPVSAMIHAAAMVSAGVFLLVRMFPLFYAAGDAAPGAMTYMAFTGAFTAIFAATIAVAQWDIKRVLAYSTISQLGFMVAAIGIGAWTAALFHLITHAFFKALLFLGSGSVIHGMEHGAHHVHEHAGHDAHGAHGAHGEQDAHDSHGSRLQRRPDGVLDPDDPQDMRNMGGLLGRMPLTGWTFIVGALSLCGFPLITAGFWSKDEILASAWYGGNFWVFFTLAVAAFLTAFYTTRQVMLTFFGKARTPAAEHAPESVRRMTWPLVAIAPFAIVLGWFGIPESFPLLGGLVPNFLEHFTEPYIEYLHFYVAHPEFNWIPLLTSVVVALGGIAVGWFVYGRGYSYEQVDPLRRLLGPVWTLLHRKFYIDELYNQTIVALTGSIAKFLYWFDDHWVIDPIVDAIGRVGLWISAAAAAFDRAVIDGAVNAAGWVSSRTGQVLRNTADGHVQSYLLVLVLAVAVWLLLKALPILMTLV
jgi:NADH-quinone oxidoreductase subunit L